MATSSIRGAVPQLLRLDIAKQWSKSLQWSPRDLLTNYFSPSLSLTAKLSWTSRFFMYEEHASNKLTDDNITHVVQKSPPELAEILHSANTEEEGHCYWTSPLANVAHPTLLTQLEGYQSLHPPAAALDPRGPSLWMGTAGSGTQAHYDVADNVLVQLYGCKRIRCFPPSAAEALHVYPDAHPRARKSQVDWDEPDPQTFPQFASLPEPLLDVTLTPGDALSIPAFWFHHVENGYDDDNPSVSLNLFALSEAMMVAQQVFQQASTRRVLPPGLEPSVALQALALALLEEALEMDARQFIRKTLLQTRYVPLGHSRDDTDCITSSHKQLSPLEQERVAINDCIAQILPLLQSLPGEGTLELVVAHLLELWAVEMVGATNVATVWEQVLVALEQQQQQ